MDGYQIDRISCNPIKQLTFIPFEMIQTLVQSKPFPNQYAHIIPKNQYLFQTKIGKLTKQCELYFEQIDYECIIYKCIPITNINENENEYKLLKLLSEKCSYVPHIYFIGYSYSIQFYKSNYRKCIIIGMEYCVTDWNDFCESIHSISIVERLDMLYKCCIRLIEIIFDLNIRQKICHNNLRLEHICFRLKADGGMEPVLIDFGDCSIYDEDDGYNDLVFFCKQMCNFYSKKDTFDKQSFNVFQKWMKKMEKQLDWDMEKCKFWCTESFQLPTPKVNKKIKSDLKIMDFSNSH